MTDPRYIRWFADLSTNDVALVGGKTASLGEMVRQLSPLGVRLVTAASLAVGSLIKLDSDVCRALVRITSAQRDPADGRCIVGGSFVTVLFSQPRGGFVSLRA